jgi:SAM-dependent methyltransferase
MSISGRLKKMFRGVTLEVDDIFLLESFQIGYLPGWVSKKDMSAVIHRRPDIEIFLRKKHPPVSSYLDAIKEKHPEEIDDTELMAAADRLLWTFADMIVYSKCPDVYDSLEFHDWDFSQVTSIVSLEGKTVIDAGAGTGRVTFEAAPAAIAVYAVEPVTRLRSFIREKARTRPEWSNVYAVDGFLHELPFPDSFAHVLITSHALGWKLEEELPEMERVVKRGGCILHCPGSSANDSSGGVHETLLAEPWYYEHSIYEESDGKKRKYWKKVH